MRVLLLNLRIWPLGILMALTCTYGQAASVSPEHVNKRYYILSYSKGDHDKVKTIVTQHLFRLGYDPRRVYLAYDGFYGDNKGGADISVPDAYAESLRAELAQYHLQLVPHEAQPEDPPETKREAEKTLHEGNGLVLRYARRILEASEIASPRDVLNDLSAEFEAWEKARLEVGGKLQGLSASLALYLVRKEVTQLRVALEALKGLGPDDLIKRLEKRGNVPQCKSNSEVAYFESLTAQERKREVRLQFLDAEIFGWFFVASRRADMKSLPETEEVIDHTFLMKLAQLESTTNHSGLPLVNRSEIVDVLNRAMPHYLWFTKPGDCGVRCRELLHKMLSYDGLIPFIKLAIAAKLGWEYGMPPTERDIKAYNRLERSVTFEKDFWGGHLTIPYLFVGSISQARPYQLSRIQVYHSLQFIDAWFAKHGLPTRDWSQVKSITLEEQSLNLQEQRQHSLCEVHFFSNPQQAPQSTDRWLKKSSPK